MGNPEETRVNLKIEAPKLLPTFYEVGKKDVSTWFKAVDLWFVA